MPACGKIYPGASSPSSPPLPHLNDMGYAAMDLMGVSHAWSENSELHYFDGTDSTDAVSYTSGKLAAKSFQISAVFFPGLCFTGKQGRRS